MGLYLTASDRRHLLAAQQTMLAPLAYEDRGAWMLAVNDRLRDLVGADHTIAFFLDEDGFEYLSSDTDLGPLSPLHDMVIGHDDAGFVRFVRTEDRAALYFELFHRMRRAGGSGAYHESEAPVTEAMKRTDHFQAMFVPVGARFMTGLSTPLPIGEATICVAYERSDARGYTEEGLRRLELVVPAFESGVRAWRRLTDHRNLIESMIPALAVLGPDGRLLFRSRGCERLLRDEPTSNEFLAAMEELARGRSAHRPLHRRKSADRDWTNSREVTTERGTYRLWASSLPPTLFGTEAVLVEVDRRDRGLPTAEQVQARFGLSPREAEVALLLAEGLDNKTIAERLHISPHTARRHTERVLRGLGVPSRAAVAMRLLRRPWSRP